MPADGENESAKRAETEGFDRIFFSYARGDDEPFVKRLYEDLTKAGFDVWFDRVSMPSRSLTFHQEIRDAISARERLILVVGPRAVTSDYVTQEWPFAYYAANKCVNPIVRLDSRDSQGNKVDGYALIPEDLKLLHAEDFRRDAEYDEHLKNLIRQLSETLPPVGKLVAVPELPPGYRAQPERLKALRDLLLLDLQKPVVVTGAAARVGLQGMGGIGKSVLANALAHHPQVQRAFRDGIYWVTFGQQPRIEELQRQLAVALDGDGQFNNRQEGKEHLRKLLADRAVLLILDDVWERDHADAFNVVSARSRILLTTRDVGLVTALAASKNHYRVELPTIAEAQAILGAAAEAPPDQLPATADAIIKECGRLPLALALCGGMVHGGSSWSNVLAALQEHDLEFLSNEHPDEAQHQDAWKAMDISVRVLPPDEQQRFAELAVFGADTGMPDAAVATLWQHTAGLGLRQTEALLAKFIRRSLVQRPSTADGEAAAHVGLHDLLHHFAIGMATNAFGSIRALHQRLLDAYRAKCPDGWPSGPNDGYFFKNLVRHIANTEASSESGALVTSFSWLMRKCELGLLDSISEDYTILRDLAQTEMKQCLGIWSEFFREKAHIFRRGKEKWPSHKILLQLAVEHSDDSPLTTAAERWLQEARCDWLWLRRVPRLSHAQKRPCSLVFEGHSQPVHGALPLDDGRLLSWSFDKTLRLWDDRGTCLAVLQGHTDYIWGALALTDGRLLSWSSDKTLRLWDNLSGACLASLEGHAGKVEGALELPEGRLLSWSSDKTLRLWDYRRCMSLAVLSGHTSGISGAIILTDGRLLSWADRMFHFWDSHSGQCLAVLEGDTDWLYGALELVDGRLLSWGSDTTLRLWNGLSYKCLAVLKGHTQTVSGALALADGRLLSRSEDQTLRLWNGNNGECLAVLRGHVGNVRGAVALANGRLLSWSSERTLRLWDGHSGACLVVLEGHTVGVTGALELADGRVVSWADNALRLWDGRTGAFLTALRGHAAGVRGALEVSGGRLLSWAENTLRYWDAQFGPRSAELEGHTNGVGGLLTLSNGCLLSWGDKTLRFWDSCTGRCVGAIDGHTDAVRGVLALPDQRLLSWSEDKTLRVWDVRNGECLMVLEGHTQRVYGALALTDGRLLSWSGDQSMRLWDGQNGNCLMVLRAGGADRVLVLAHERLLSWSLFGSTLRLWDAKSGECLAALKGHTGILTGALALADGRLLSWSADNTLRLWDGHSGACLAVLKGHSGLVYDALELADGRLLSTSEDKTLRLWDGHSGTCLAVFAGHPETVLGALELTDGRLLSWTSDKTFRVWDRKSGACLGEVSDDQVGERQPDWLHARAKLQVLKWGWDCVFAEFVAVASVSMTHLRHQTKPFIFAAWNGDGESMPKSLLPDGTVVVTQNNGQVGFLKLHYGNRRISLAEAEEILAWETKQTK